MATSHDIEEMFLGYPFNVCVESASIADSTSLVCSLVDVVNGNGGGKFFSGEAMFSDKLSVDAGDVGTGIYQCGRVDDFKGVQEGDQLYWNMHRFVQS